MPKITQSAVSVNFPGFTPPAIFGSGLRAVGAELARTSALFDRMEAARSNTEVAQATIGLQARANDLLLKQREDPTNPDAFREDLATLAREVREDLSSARGRDAFTTKAHRILETATFNARVMEFDRTKSIERSEIDALAESQAEAIEQADNDVSIEA